MPKCANSDGTFTKRTVTRNGKWYTLWEDWFTTCLLIREVRYGK